MSGVASAAETAWRALGVVLLHGTVLAGLAWLLAATVLRRARPAALAALWAIVLIKFALPIGPALPFSLSDGLARLWSSAPVVTAGPIPTGPALTGPVVAAPGAWAWLALIGLGLWLAGLALVAVRTIAVARRAHRTAIAAPTAPVEVTAVAAEVAARLGLVRVPDIRIAADGVAPWLVGVRRPRVVIPAALVGPTRRAELVAALTHELAHLRRRDAWLRVVQLAVGTLFFWFPVVRWVNRRIDHAREMACDAWAVARGPLDGRDYARMLVAMVRDQAAPAGALGLAATPGLLRGRVEALLVRRPDGEPAVGKIGAVALTAWTALALGGATAVGGTAPEVRVCVFSPSVAAQLLASHPEADLDGDGVLTRDEACGFQLTVKRRLVDDAIALTAAPLPRYDAAFDLDRDGTLSPIEAANRFERYAASFPDVAGAASADQLCCNCVDAGGTSPRLNVPEPGAARPALEAANTCVRGVTP
jgi:beta-lactamase regulating signal transducer with metallopeptidase domain